MEQEIYDYDTESNTDIMMLIRKNEKVRMVSIKINPWIAYGEKCDETKNEH